MLSVFPTGTRNIESENSDPDYRRKTIKMVWSCETNGKGKNSKEKRRSKGMGKAVEREAWLR